MHVVWVFFQEQTLSTVIRELDQRQFHLRVPGDQSQSTRGDFRLQWLCTLAGEYLVWV